MVFFPDFQRSWKPTTFHCFYLKTAPGGALVISPSAARGRKVTEISVAVTDGRPTQACTRHSESVCRP